MDGNFEYSRVPRKSALEYPEMYLSTKRDSVFIWRNRSSHDSASKFPSMDDAAVDGGRAHPKTRCVTSCVLPQPPAATSRPCKSPSHTRAPPPPACRAPAAMSDAEAKAQKKREKRARQKAQRLAASRTTPRAFALWHEQQRRKQRSRAACHRCACAHKRARTARLFTTLESSTCLAQLRTSLSLISASNERSTHTRSPDSSAASTSALRKREWGELPLLGSRCRRDWAA